MTGRPHPGTRYCKGPGGGGTVAVVGSVNIDTRLQVRRIPRPGETTLTVAASHASLGGKGANQAVAAAKLGASVGLLAAVGSDRGGDIALACLRDAGVDVGSVRRDEALPTGVAYVMVDADGENSIVVDSGANRRPFDESSTIPDAVRMADVILAQLEVPAHTVAAVFRAAHRRRPGASTILNAAPAPAEWSPELEELIAETDILVLNEIEAHQLSALVPGREAVAGEPLLGIGPRAVVITQGAAGIDVVERGARRHVPALAARVVDTTGAGDAACGGIAVALAEGAGIVEAALFGAACGSWAVRSPGSVDSYADREDIAGILGETRVSDVGAGRPATGPADMAGPEPTGRAR